jgi:hypothetical protein
MKPPWKIIGQLISRRRSPEPALDPSDADATTQASGREAEETAVPLSTPVLALREPRNDEDQTFPAASLDEGEGDSDSPAAIPASVEQVETQARQKPTRPRVRKTEATRTAPPDPKPKRVRQSKKASAETVAQKTGAPANLETRSVPPNEVFYAEVAGVDTEIRELRGKLARKLIQQNAQLRKMLERFGVS